MPLNTGEGTLADLLAARHTSLAAFGQDNVVKILEADAAVWNFLVVTGLMPSFIEISEDLQRVYGSSVGGAMKEVDELGRAETQAPSVSSEVAFPLRHFQYNLGWSHEWMKKHSVADMAIMVQAAQQAHLRRIYVEIQRGIFGASNFTFNDYTQKGISLTIRRFLNGDGSAIPNGPNAETFNASTHTHYTAIASLTAASVTALINNVLEHRPSAGIKAAFSSLDETSIRALTGFTAYPDPRFRLQFPGNTTTPIKTVDYTRLSGRAIGTFGAAEVWIEPWVPQNYGCAWDEANPEKSLVMRVEVGSGGPALQDVQTIYDHPLHIDYKESYFGIGAYTRTAAAALYFNVSGTWADATFTT